MNKTTEALKLAEKAANRAITTLEYFKTIGIHSDSIDPTIRAEKKALAAIREVLAEPEITTPDVCGEVCARAKLRYGCGKALDAANARHEPLCEDEGCPHHGTPHICVSDPSVLANHSGDGNEMVAEPAIPEWVDVDDYEEPVKQEPVAFEQCEELSADKARWYRMADMIEQQAQELKDVLRQALNLIEGEWPEGDEVAQPIVDKIKKLVGERSDG
jgi:hypothetical protein